MTFDLRHQVAALYRQSGEYDPSTLADKALELVPVGEEREALRYLMRIFCRDVIRTTRGVPPVVTPDTSIAASGKWSTVRQRWLSDAYCVDGEWKLLADHNATDCDWHSQAYADRAAENMVWSGRFSRLAEELRKAHKGKIADLPFTVVEEVMSS